MQVDIKQYTYALEYSGGLGDVLLQMYEGDAYNQLSKLGSGERAYIQIICHNPHAKEFFESHPKQGCFDVRCFDYWPPGQDAEKRKELGIPKIKNPSFGVPNPLVLYPSSEDKKVLDTIKGKYYVLAASAGLPDRSIPEVCLRLIVDYCKRQGVRLIATGKNYTRFDRIEVDVKELGIESVIDQLSPAGVYELLRKSEGVICCHSFSNIAGWILRKPTLLLYPQSVKDCHISKNDRWAFGVFYPETLHSTFDSFQVSLLDEFFYGKKQRKNKVVAKTKNCVFTASLSSISYWEELIESNLKKGKPWYFRIPDNWWWGMSSQEYLGALHNQWALVQKQYERCVHTIFRYAQSIQADFVCKGFKEYHVSNIPHVEKLHIGKLLDDYDRVLWLDSDIIVKPSAPDIFQYYPLEHQVYLLDEHLFVNHNQNDVIRNIMKTRGIFTWPVSEYQGKLPSSKYRYSYFNTGVMLFSKEQKQFFAAFDPKDYFEHIFEQTYFNLLFMKTCRIGALSYKFNSLVGFTKFLVDFDPREDGYFVHYGGRLFEHLESDYVRWFQNTSPISMSVKQIQTRNEFSGLLNKFAMNGVGVEVGVAEGEFSKIISKQWKFSKYFLIDSWQHFASEVYNDINNVSDEEHKRRHLAVMDHFKDNSNVIIVRQFSAHAALMFSDNSLDWVYIDANHKYEAVKQDLALWFPKIKHNGILSGYDYIKDEHYKGMGEFGVKRAVDEFVEKFNLMLYTTKENFPSWYVFKP